MTDPIAAQPDDVESLIASLTKECKATDAGCPECARDRKLAAAALRWERADRDRLAAECADWKRKYGDANEWGLKNTAAWKVRAEKAEAEVERLRADAERYRYVRAKPEMLLHLSNADFDAAIDAARAGAGK